MPQSLKDVNKIAHDRVVWRQATESSLDRVPSVKEEGDMKTETDSAEEGGEFLIRDYILSEKHGSEAELWDAEFLNQVEPSRLATLVCGFLNTEEGGAVFIGVKTNCLVRGVLLDRAKRDKMRQILDRVLANQINP